MPIRQYPRFLSHFFRYTNRYLLTSSRITSRRKVATPKWKALRSVGMAITESTTGGKTTSEVRLYITSLPADAKRFGHAVRAHWGIETSLHWTLDIAFREDESRIRKDNAPENFAVSRHIALSLLKQEKSFTRGIAMKRFRAAMRLDYLEKVILG